MLKLYHATSKRLTKEERAAIEAKGLHAYDRRDCGRETSIEPHVAVDYIETIITNFEIEFPKSGPSVGMILDGDAYLAAIGARNEHDLKELEKKDREWAVEYGCYVDGHIWETHEATIVAATEAEALEAASSLSDELEAKENAEHPDHETTYLIEELYEIETTEE